MKTALIATSLHTPQWSALRAGLVWVSAALAEGAHHEGAAENSTLPYRQYSALRQEPLAQRLDRLDAENAAELRNTLLSFVGEPPSDRIANQLHKHLRHPEAGVRAAALCALASHSHRSDAKGIGTALEDASPSVRMASVYALQNRPDLWPSCKTPFRNLFSDASFDIRYEALRLAKKMAYPDFARSIVAGLSEDAIEGRMANFAARKDALEAITRERFSLQPALSGQPPHGEDARVARVDLARRWEKQCRHI